MRAFTQISNITQYYYSFFLLRSLCMVVSNRRKILFSPESLLFNPDTFFHVVVVAVVYAHNRFQFHHWNLLQYSIQPCKRYFFFDSLSLSHSANPWHSTSHSPFNVIGESESNFFLQKKAVVQCIMAKDENRCVFWNDSNDVCVRERVSYPIVCICTYTTLCYNSECMLRLFCFLLPFLYFMLCLAL